MIQNMSERANLRDKVVSEAADIVDRVKRFEDTIEDLRVVRDFVVTAPSLDDLITRLGNAANRIPFAPNYKVRLTTLAHELVRIQDAEAVATAEENARLAAEPDYSVPSLSKLINQLPKAVGVEGLEVKALDLIPRIVDAAGDVLRKSKGHEEENEELMREVNGLRKSLGWATKYVPREKPKPPAHYSGAPTPGHGGKTFRSPSMPEERDHE